MIALLDTSEPLAKCAAEMGDGFCVGQLLTPRSRFKNRAVEEGRPFAIDNYAYADFNPNEFRLLLARQLPNRDKCLFVAAPDVVCSARRTLELFRHWYPKLQGWPIALVIQNGQEDLDIPWSLINAVFIGGDDAFKTSQGAEAICKCAKAMEKHVHVGRVNTPHRLDRVMQMGADSIDGSGISQYTHMRTNVRDGLPLFNERVEKNASSTTQTTSAA